jgi:hypothetical protein
MMGSWSSQKSEVGRLSAAAGLAAEREQQCREGLVRRARRIAKSGKVIGLGAIAGFALVAVFRRDDGDDREKSDDNTHRAGIVAQAGNQVLHLLQFVLTSSHLWNSITASPQVPSAAESIQGS